MLTLREASVAYEESDKNARIALNQTISTLADVPPVYESLKSVRHQLMSGRQTLPDAVGDALDILMCSKETIQKRFPKSIKEVGEAIAKLNGLLHSVSPISGQALKETRPKSLFNLATSSYINFEKIATVVSNEETELFDIIEEVERNVGDSKALCSSIKEAAFLGTVPLIVLSSVLKEIVAAEVGVGIPEFKIGDVKEPNAVHYLYEIKVKNERDPNTSNVIKVHFYGAPQQVDARVSNWVQKGYPEDKGWYGEAVVLEGPEMLDQTNIPTNVEQA
jgi:hypothetical protein